MVIDNITKKADTKGSGKAKKERVIAPPSKIVIRKLPPTYTEEEFRNAIAPVPENNYFAFVSADKGLGLNAYSRAYISFTCPEEIVSFRDRFNGYVFVDQKGNEYPAVVEYAPFQKIPKPNYQKKDIRCGTITEDSDYIAFLDLIQNPETVNLPQIEALLEEIENMEKESRANNGVFKVKTPLLEYVEQRNAERFRSGDKKRRKEYDRKKTREDEKRRRKDMNKEYRKRDDYYAREERAKKKEEDKLKWKEKREEKEKHAKREKIDRYKNEEKIKSKEATADAKYSEELPNEKPYSKNLSYGSKKDYSYKEEKPKQHRTKRYSEARKKDDRDKKPKEDKRKPPSEFEDAKLEEEEPVPPPPCGIPITETSMPLQEVVVKEESEDVKEDGPGEEECEEPEEVKEELEMEGDVECDKSAKILDEEDKVDYSEDAMTKDDRDDDKSNKDPRTERRIRNKDRPAMQLYRPGQARLKTRLKPGEEYSGGLERGIDFGDSSSSTSTSPVLEVSEEKKDKLGEPEQAKVHGNKGHGAKGASASAAPFDKKVVVPKYRDSRSSTYYWDDRDAGGYGRYREDYEGGTAASRGGSRKGYSYHQERESKGKWLSKGSTKEGDNSQFKSLTFRRSTSQE